MTTQPISQSVLFLDTDSGETDYLLNPAHSSVWILKG